MALLKHLVVLLVNVLLALGLDLQSGSESLVERSFESAVALDGIDRGMSDPEIYDEQDAMSQHLREVGMYYEAIDSRLQMIESVLGISKLGMVSSNYNVTSELLQETKPQNKLSTVITSAKTASPGYESTSPDGETKDAITSVPRIRIEKRSINHFKNDDNFTNTISITEHSNELDGETAHDVEIRTPAHKKKSHRKKPRRHGAKPRASGAKKNIAVYYGQSPYAYAAGPLGLLTLCQRPDIDIINLAFVSHFFGPGGYPVVSFGPACSGQTTAQANLAPGLQNCTILGDQISQCQKQYGKIITVSLGGYVASSAFASAAHATKFASTLWALFGKGGHNLPDRSLRPFGPGVVVDGFDIDNEDHSTSHYVAFARALRKLYATDPARRYYLTAVPQCPRPDESIPKALMRMADFVYVQFYNNPSCNLNAGAAFLESFAAWSKDLSIGRGRAKPPRVFVGMGAWPDAGSGYVNGNGLSAIMAQVRALKTQNFGGVMLWDGTSGLANVNAEGKDYIKMVAQALG